MSGNSNYTYQYHRGYHVRVGVDSYLNEEGSPFMNHDGHPGSAMETCEHILNLLGWTYEYVFYDKELGQENPTDPKASTGMIGDLVNGKLDFICANILMTPDRKAVMDFSYPTRFSMKQAYLVVNDFGVEYQAPFIGRAFSKSFWLAIFLTIVIIIGSFMVMRIILFRAVESRIWIFRHSIMWFLELTMLLKFGIPRDRRFSSPKLASLLWMLLWGRVILELYQANLKTYLTVPDEIAKPFVDFDSFLQNLRSGAYRYAAFDAKLYPRCSDEYDGPGCVAMFGQLLEERPPVAIKNTDAQTICRQFMSFKTRPLLVTHIWLPISHVPESFSVWTNCGFGSKMALIRDDTVFIPPASMPVRKGFLRLPDLNDAIIFLMHTVTVSVCVQPSFQTIESHYINPYPRVTLTPTRSQKAYSIVLLSSSFELLAFGLCVSVGALCIEKAVAKVFGKEKMPKENDPESYLIITNMSPPVYC